MEAVEEDLNNEIENSEPVVETKKQKKEVKKPAAPKVEVKPVKIETPVKEDSDAKLAPIPMAKPF